MSKQKTKSKIPKFDPQEVNNLLLNRDYEAGGVDAILSGEPGCGKTNALVRICLYNIENYNDIVLWRGTNKCQWNRFLDKKDVILWIYEENEIYSLVDRGKEKRIDLEEKVKDIKYWSDGRDLVKQLKDHNDVINAIYTVPRTNPLKFIDQWYDIIKALTKRIWNDEVTLSFDEFEDLAPLNAQGKIYKKVGQIGDIIKEMRKNHISGFYSSHKETLIDWRVLIKIRWSLYMKRAVVKPRRVPNSFKFSSVNNLNIGAGWICNKNYEKINFGFEGKEKEWILDFEFIDEEE